MLLHRLLLVFALFLTIPTWALTFQESPAVADVFHDVQIRGTFVLYDVSKGKLIGYDQQRAKTRFNPASTFKIPNSLIGLSSGAVQDVDELFWKWDGKPKYLASWEQDMGLRGAIKVSNLEAYQLLARRVGLEQMKKNVARLNYGNSNIGDSVDTFWIDGALKISAIEQVIFLANLAQGKLPFPEKAQAAVREITILEKGQGWVLHGKTGWADKEQPNIGWFVGWVEQQGKIASFALNIDMLRDAGPSAPPTALAKRQEIAKASLRALGFMR